MIRATCLQSILKELLLWSKLDHANVLPLVGFVMSGSIPALVSEWMPYGSVESWLKLHPGDDRLTIVRDVSRIRFLDID